jgi:hypothetical protein
VQQQSAAAKTPPADRKRPLQPSQAAERPSTTPPPLATDQKAGGGVSASAPRSTAIAILLRLSLPKTLAVIRHGVCRDNRGRNGQRWLVTGGGGPGMLFEAGRLRRPEARDDGEGVAALVTI